MKLFLRRYKQCFKDKDYVLSFVITWVLIVVSLFVNYAAALYAEVRASNAVTDIFLSNIPIFEVGSFFVYGTIIFWITVVLVLLWRPERIPFTLKSVALFILIRSVFISLTHLGPFPTHIVVDSNILSLFSTGGDLFFSGHTGFPVLMALIFWKDIWLRVIFYAAALFFAAIVLLGHVHYSIDVLSAFFITYAIYHIAVQFFPHDYEQFVVTKQ